METAARRLILLIRPEWDGKRADTLLRRELLLSGSAVKRAKRLPGGILLDGVPVFGSVPVHAGELLSVAVGDSAYGAGLLPVSGPLSIRYEDDDLLILDKPAGTPVHPGPNHAADTLANYLTQYYQDCGLVAGFHPVNRLDKGTSGLMAVAKYSHAHDRMKAALHTGSFRRTYLAVCQGTLSPASGVVDAPIGRAPDEVLRREVRPDGAPARTRYHVLAEQNGRSLVRLELETGRTHQIRVHLADLGCPLCGDFLYGTELPELPGRFALHSASLSLIHPITGADLHFESPLPGELSALLEES